ncbi:hypothetical protein [Zooshikella ganghwensis]|nr:hypothetical protein [Zooshikella ganghwensis]
MSDIFQLLLYIATPYTFYLLINFFVLKDIAKGSDHSVHLGLIRRIKSNGNKYGTYLTSKNEKNLLYPQLYHLMLSYFDIEWLEKKYSNINILIHFLDYLCFNLFASYFFYMKLVPLEFFFWVNIIYITFPISYAVWNAKNGGLSARAFGLLLTNIYVYLIAIYIIEGEIELILLMIPIATSVLFSSQMGWQFILLGTPFLSLYYNDPILLIIPIACYILFFMIIPKKAKSFMCGQYYHKKNYALFLSKIFILRYRNSVYLDFLSDFYKELKNNLVRGLYYIYTNPIVVAIYGVPYLWLVLLAYALNANDFSESILLGIIYTSLLLFILTSFKNTRFLGEPQRYLEFSIPIISVLLCFNYNFIAILIISLMSSIFIILSNRIISLHKGGSDISKDRIHIINELRQIAAEKLVVSNDNDLLKYMPELKAECIRPDFTCNYKNKEEFYRFYYDYDVNKISISGVLEFIESYSPDFVVINKKIYSDCKIKWCLKNYCFNKTVGDFVIYNLR